MALVALAMVSAGCATAPETYRLEAEVGDFLGFPTGATAIRGASQWTIERRIDAHGVTRRFHLSKARSLALDAAVADPALYATPALRPGDDCIDVAPISLDVLANGATRRLVLNCETSPGLEAVLRILFDGQTAGGRSS